VQTVRTAPLIGLIAEVALLAALAHTVGLSVTGWSVGILCALTTNVILTRALARSRASAFGPANWVTLARSTFVAGIAALIAEALVQAASAAAIVTLTVVALVLDSVDGRVARRTASATAVGARFDMEVDAFLILVLSAYVAQSFGVWVLTIGAARYTAPSRSSSGTAPAGSFYRSALPVNIIRADRGPMPAADTRAQARTWKPLPYGGWKKKWDSPARWKASAPSAIAPSSTRA